MKIVIVGAGKIGYSLAEELANENHDITVVDIEKEKVKLLSDTLDVMTLCGNGAAISVQREANVDESDLLIAVTAQDELNMLACIVARKLGCKNTIARVRNLEYTEQLYVLKSELGLSMTINPELLAAKEIYRLLQIPAFIKRDTFAEGKAEIVELFIADGSPLDGLQLADLRRKIRVHVLICAVLREEKVFIPDGSFVLRKGDKIYVTAPASSLVELTHELKLRSKKQKRAHRRRRQNRRVPRSDADKNRHKHQAHRDEALAVRVPRRKIPRGERHLLGRLESGGAQDAQHPPDGRCPSADEHG